MEEVGSKRSKDVTPNITMGRNSRTTPPIYSDRCVLPKSSRISSVSLVLSLYHPELCSVVHTGDIITKPPFHHGFFTEILKSLVSWVSHCYILRSLPLPVQPTLSSSICPFTDPLTEHTGHRRLYHPVHCSKVQTVQREEGWGSLDYSGVVSESWLRYLWIIIVYVGREKGLPLYWTRSSTLPSTMFIFTLFLEDRRSDRKKIGSLVHRLIEDNITRVLS